MQAFKHQEETANFWSVNKNIFDMSDPGTGKTIANLAGYMKCKNRERYLVVAPLSILRPAWGDDITKFAPSLSYAIAHGSEKKRIRAFESDADVVIINHDGIKWLAKHPNLLAGFSHMTIDEFTAFKKRTTQRSKALAKIAKIFEYISMLSGTPNSNKLVDLWFPASVLDNGMRLGSNYYRFQNQVCEPISLPFAANATEWREKEEAREMVAEALRDITIRHVFEDCTDIPPNSKNFMLVDLPKQVIQQYKELERHAYLELEKGEISAMHRGALTKKLLQLLTGAIYNKEGEAIDCHPHRYELCLELIQQRDQCIVAFNWRHERVALTKLADQLKIPYGIIDGSVSTKDRERYVDEFQSGKLKVMFCHPQSAGHGLTLTAATSTIWCSPTYNAEHFAQFNRRIYRTGQKKKTETLMIAARGTVETKVYEVLDGKMERMDDLLGLFAQLTKAVA